MKTKSSRLALSLVLVTPIVAALCLVNTVPDYLIEQGFPLDDAWIHMVYAREFARTATLAYNPGVPAAGETSPLWAVIVSPVFLLFENIATSIFYVKLLGLALHVATVIILYLALSKSGEPIWLTAVTVMIMGANPELLAASASGMEVPLATLTVASLLLLVQYTNYVAFGVVSALAFLARPEIAVLAPLFPTLLLLRSSETERRRFMRLLASAIGGSVLSVGAVAVRNMVVTGRPLPSTFYAKVGSPGLNPLEANWIGFNYVLDMGPGFIDLLFISLVLIVSVAVMFRPEQARIAIAPMMYVSGILFCALSFVLIPPVDPYVFYHQRYVIPAFPMMLASGPLVLGAAVARIRCSEHAISLIVLAASVLVAIATLMNPSQRYLRLANDTRNIDDVQVQLGRFLEHAQPSEIVWAIDAGAVRFFGNAFVVDMIGLNTPEILTADAQTYLNQHPPNYIDIFPTWSALDEASAKSMRFVKFEATTPYSVTGNAFMRAHFLASCSGEAVSGRLIVRNKDYTFRCN